MKYYDITFRSVTYAQRGETAMRKAGIWCTLGRAPRAMEERGCGYRLTLGIGDGPRAMAVLKEQRIPYRKIYARTGDGWNEVTL